MRSASQIVPAPRGSHGRLTGTVTSALNSADLGEPSPRASHRTTRRSREAVGLPLSRARVSAAGVGAQEKSCSVVQLTNRLSVDKWRHIFRRNFRKAGNRLDFQSGRKEMCRHSWLSKMSKSGGRAGGFAGENPDPLCRASGPAGKRYPRYSVGSFTSASTEESLSHPPALSAVSGREEAGIITRWLQVRILDMGQPLGARARAPPRRSALERPGVDSGP